MSLDSCFRGSDYNLAQEFTTNNPTTLATTLKTWSLEEPDISLPLSIMEGEPASMKCESTEKFDNCKFKDPQGNIHEIGIGGGSYNKKRVDCLCSEEEYDPTRVCGIYISNTKMEDTGKWR